MQLFDTHTHYTDPRFDSDRDGVLSSLPDYSVCGVIECACTEADWDKVSLLAQKYPFVKAAYGVHGLNVEDITDDGWPQRLKERVLSDPNCVAIGEIGLDYHYSADKKDLQKQVFALQLDMALALDRPVIIHDRDAHKDVSDALWQRKGICGVLHCYSGSAEMVRELAPLGLYFGFGGSVTFKNNEKGAKAAKAVPLDRLLIETDCPYLAPVPHRGKRNFSGLLPHVCERLGEILGLPAEEVARLTRENANRLFGLSL